LGLVLPLVQRRELRERALPGRLRPSEALAGTPASIGGAIMSGVGAPAHIHAHACIGGSYVSTCDVGDLNVNLIQETLDVFRPRAAFELIPLGDQFNAFAHVANLFFEFFALLCE
jgi:hypothetical protein